MRVVFGLFQIHVIQLDNFLLRDGMSFIVLSLRLHRFLFVYWRDFGLVILIEYALKLHKGRFLLDLILYLGNLILDSFLSLIFTFLGQGRT